MCLKTLPELTIMSLFTTMPSNSTTPWFILGVVCLFVFVLDPYPHLSRGVNSRGRTYGETPLPPRPLVTPGPRCSSCSLSPHTYCHASCIRSVPSPVLLSYTDILPSIWSAPSLSSCPTHINNPHTYEPLKPTYKLCYLLISTALS